MLKSAKKERMKRATHRRVDPVLLGRLNVRRVLEVIQSAGPASRAEVTRRSGLTAPTVSKAVESLLKSGLLEEGDAPRSAVGRPARVLRLASTSLRAVGVVFDAPQCAVLHAGLDGKYDEADVQRFPTPGSYRGAIDAIVRRVQPLLKGRPALGVGISMPGLINRTTGEGILSPNVHITDGHAPARDLAERLGVECVLRQEAHALCLGEWLFGAARGLDDFAMLDVSTGLGLGVMSGGRLLVGATGFAGELGHMAVDPQGRLCGCGNRGCLETFATDSALAHAASERLKEDLDIDAVLARLREGDARLEDPLRRTCEYLAMAVGGVINVFNPGTLFVHGRLLEAREGLFGYLLELVRRSSLGPALAACRVVQARGNKHLGAIAALVTHRLDALAPRLH
jgi:predicted NBD/HSP70 family sugar kinase